MQPVIYRNSAASRQYTVHREHRARMRAGLPLRTCEQSTGVLK